jgi:hypothetical protein
MSIFDEVDVVRIGRNCSGSIKCAAFVSEPFGVVEHASFEHIQTQFTSTPNIDFDSAVPVCNNSVFICSDLSIGFQDEHGRSKRSQSHLEKVCLQSIAKHEYMDFPFNV